jgi:hypothetical protein
MSRLAEAGNEEAADRLGIRAAERLAELAAGRGDADTLTYLIDVGSGLVADHDRAGPRPSLPWCCSSCEGGALGRRVPR